MKKLMTLGFAMIGSLLIGQVHPTCDGSRYVDDIFVDVQSTTAIKFGEGTTYAGSFQELYLDVYEPVGDVATNRPCIILAFGGSFISGTRDEMQWICEDYARKGFVAVSVDYRLYDGPLFPIPGAEIMREVVVKAYSDIKASIRFMRESSDMGNQYGIDPDLIFIGGISAGAIATFHAAVMDENDTFSSELQSLLDDIGGFEGNSSTNTHISSEVQGMINFSGALNEADWIDEDDPTFFSVHDDQDPVVPYGQGSATIFGFPIIEMEGSLTMKERADAINLDNELVTVNSSGHVSYFINPNDQKVMIDRSAVFLHNIICPGVSDVKNLSLNDLQVYPNPSSGFIVLESERAIDQVQVYDLMGKQVGMWNNSTQIELSHLPIGNYILEARIENQKIRKRIHLNQ